MQSENINNNNPEPTKAHSLGLAKSALGWLNRVISGTAQDISDFSSILASQVPVPQPVQLKPELKAEKPVEEVEINLFPESLAQNIIQPKQKQTPIDRANSAENSGQKQLVAPDSNQSDFKVLDKEVLTEQPTDSAEAEQLECESPEGQQVDRSVGIIIDESSQAACAQLLAPQLKPLNSLDFADESNHQVMAQEEPTQAPLAAVVAVPKEDLQAKEASKENEALLEELSGTSSKKLQAAVANSSVASSGQETETLESSNVVAATSETVEGNKPVLPQSLSPAPKAPLAQTGPIPLAQSFLNTWTASDPATMDKNGDPRSFSAALVNGKNSGKIGNDLNAVTGLQSKGNASAAVNAADRAMNFAVGLNALESGPKSESSKALKAMTRSQSAATLERVEAALQKASESKDGTQISLRLDPPSLGSVKVDVSFKEGSLHARISAESVQVLQLLREKAPELQVVLRKLGLDAEKVSVSVNSGDSGLFQEGSDGKQGRSQGNSGSNFADSANFAAQPDLVNLDHWIA